MAIKRTKVSYDGKVSKFSDWKKAALIELARYDLDATEFEMLDGFDKGEKPAYFAKCIAEFEGAA